MSRQRALHVDARLGEEAIHAHTAVTQHDIRLSVDALDGGFNLSAAPLQLGAFIVSRHEDAVEKERRAAPVRQHQPLVHGHRRRQ